MHGGPTDYRLEIRSAETTWVYLFDRGDYSLLESTRLVNGEKVEISRHSDFRVNTGLKADHFRF